MVILLPLFCGLGIWQLDRAEQKRRLAAAVEARRTLPAALLDRSAGETGQWEFRQISAEGRFLEEKTLLIENRKHLGQSGYHVITPLRLAQSGRVVLVNRGWIPRRRSADTASLQPPSGLLRLTGELRLLQPPALELAFTEQGGEGPPRWPYLTPERFTQWSGLEVLPLLVLQSPDDEGGFVRDWPPPRFSDAMHIGYAIQWFAFALIALLIWLRLSLPRRMPREAIQ